MMPGSSFRMNPPAPLPFIPSSVTPLTQFPGGSAQQSEKRPPPPPPPPNVAPPPFTRQDIPPPPPSPPPLPITQPPSVPPPPNSPPPLQPATDPSDSQKQRSHPRWQGSLSKSGLHYCSIYASRIELDACRYEHAVSEPTGWPSRLDVTKRTDYQHVKTTFSNTPPSKVRL
jgi:activating signal cointegrator complex subunit 2